MSPVEVDTLDAALISTLRTARDLGTWDTEWYDYAPFGWRDRVRRAPRAMVADTAAYLATTILDEIADLGAFVERLMRQDAEFAEALLARYSRDDTPLVLAEVFAHFENARRDAR